MTKKFFSRNYEIPTDSIYVNYENDWITFNFTVKDKVTGQVDKVIYCPYYNVCEPYSGLSRAIAPHYKTKNYWGYSDYSKKEMTYEAALGRIRDLFGYAYENDIHWQLTNKKSGPEQEYIFSEGKHKLVDVFPNTKKVLKKWWSKL